VNRKHIVAALLIAVVALIVAWLIRNTYWGEVDIPIAPGGEAARNPFYSIEHFAHSLGVHTELQAGTAKLPGPDSVLYLTSRHWDLAAGRRRALESWVASGGRLVVIGEVYWNDESMQDWAGVSAKVEANRAADDSERRRPSSGSGRDADCATAYVTSGPASDRFGTREYRMCRYLLQFNVASNRPPAWIVDAGDGPLAIRVRKGLGSVTILSTGLWFDNQAVLRGDHAKLFAAAGAFRPGDALWLVRDVTGESLNKLAWRVGAPVIVLLAVALAAMIWRGMRRFGPIMREPDPGRRSLAEQIRGTALFTWRVGDYQSLQKSQCRALTEAARRQLRGYDALNVEQQARAIAGATGLEAPALAAAMTNRGDVKHLVRERLQYMETARRLLTSGSSRDARKKSPQG
jgi:hypothetical protein